MTLAETTQVPFESGEFYSGNPFPVFARLREEEPVYYREDLNIWFLTRYDDLVSVSRNARLFSSASGVLLKQLIEQNGSTGYFEVDTVATTDPPRHGVLRRMVAPAFTPRRVAALESKVRELCRGIVDALPAEEDVDFVATVAEVVPLVVIANILGVVDYDVSDISRWSGEIVRQTEDMTPEEKASSVAIFSHLTEYVREQISYKRAHPAEDLLSTLVEVEPKLSDADILAWSTLMMSAGHETTRSLIGNIVDVLDSYPEQLAAVSSDITQIQAVIDETMRWRGVVTGFGRRVTSDCTLGGQDLRAGAGVFMIYMSANRDPSVFSNAEAFDFREPRSRDNLGFGVGNHFCIGQQVAHLETRVIFEELFRRFKGWSVAERTQVASTLRIGNSSLKVKFHER